ncbi:MAG TPA: NAD(+)/NADH kinase [Candidatus Dormibacteraeota bacterium]|nr:NAD(+)/NADH kinase [Candidatus Dormibacteraeota bacterium]
MIRACIVHHPRVDPAHAEAALAAAGIESWSQLRDLDGAAAGKRLARTDLVVTLGGDGTFLRGARLALPHDLPVLGVNHGRLGMLTELDPAGLEVGIARYLAGDYRVEERTAISSELRRAGGVVEKCLGLNETMVHRAASLKLIRLALSMDNLEIGTIDADGALVATASGSTAYALALGGPILEPTLPDLVLVPMNPFALTVRPIVLNPGVHVAIKLIGNAAGVTTDGYVNWRALAGDELRVAAYPSRLKVIRFRGPAEFYRVLREKIGWGAPLVPRPPGTAIENAEVTPGS